MRFKSEKMTSKEIVDSIMSHSGFKCIENKGLYIIYNKKSLFTPCTISSTDFVESSTSIQELKGQFILNPDEKQKDCNCTNGEALKRIKNLENVIKHIINAEHPEEIFKHLPYTKQGKFSKNGNISLYIPDIKSTYNGDYFSQTEIALQLVPLELCYNFISQEKSAEICTLEINPYASFTAKRPKNIIDETGRYTNYTKPKRNTYLKQTDIKAGCSYIDAKGTEFLCLGTINSIFDYNLDHMGCPISHKLDETCENLYLKVTAKLKADLTKYDSLSDFLKYRFNTILLKTPYNWLRGLNMSKSKKFVKLGSEYFMNKDDSIFQLSYSKGSIKSEPNLSCTYTFILK